MAWRQHWYVLGNWRRMPRPVNSWMPRKEVAAKGVTARRARGRRAVRRTWGSRLRSQRSLMVQPAPRIIREPRPKRAVIVRMVVGGGIY